MPHPAPRESRPRGVHGLAALLPIVAVLAAVVALSFLSGGYIFSRTAPLVLVVLPLAGVWVWLAPRRLRLDPVALVALSAFALFALWEGLSIVWSIGPDLSWLAFDLTAFYVVVAAVVLSTPAGPWHLRLAGYGFVVAMVPVAVYAMLGKVLPDKLTHAHLYARLSAPVGYWNVLAVLQVMAIVPALEGASRRGLPAAARGACAGALALFLFTLFFAFSRGGSLALVLALVVYFALSNERLQGVLSLVLAAAPVAVALYGARHLHTLFNATANDALRTGQGHDFARSVALAIVAAAVLQVAAALVTRRVTLAGRVRTVVGAAVLVAAIVLVAVGGLAFAARNGGVSGMAHKVARQFSSSDSGGATSSSGAGRLLNLGNNGRIPMARDGLRSFTHHPLAGTGAGTFRFINDLYRANGSIIVRHAHNQWVNVLSETGVVGFVLFVLFVGGLLVAALRPLGRAGRDADRGLLAALQAASVAFVAHLTIDWDWDVVAAALAFLLLAGVAAAYVRGRRTQLAAAAAVEADDIADAGRAAARPRRAAGLRFGLASRVLATGLLVLLALSFVAPFLSGRALSRAVALASEQRTAPAAAQARRAHRLDPLAVDPLFTLAQVEQQQGKTAHALATLQQAVHLQPQNFATWYELGLLQLDVLGQRAQAAASLRRAVALNPHDRNSLDELQAALAPAAAP
ncbi:MAG TPA: O-antigen ligase family protein [Thermoleophilia bacterium]|nr:O-antigen ligase family protein [Thermoleophilia bacterium]